MSQFDVLDVALKRLSHVPSIFSNHQKLAAWTDIKEVFLWCPYSKCKVVLTALKCLLRFPDSEKCMHACTQLEHVLFLRQYMLVPTGTLLVDVNALKNLEVLATLHEMVRRKHAASSNSVIVTCGKQRKDMVSRYAHTSFKVPVDDVLKKSLLPAVQQQIPSHDLDSSDLEENDPQKRQMSNVLVPLAVLQTVVPGCAGFLSELTEQYMLGRATPGCPSVCLCAVIEGLQLTRFLASQYGYADQWRCVTSSCLLVEWDGFWLAFQEKHGQVESPDFSIVTLDCQVHDVKQVPTGKSMSAEMKKDISLASLEIKHEPNETRKHEKEILVRGGKQTEKAKSDSKITATFDKSMKRDINTHKIKETIKPLKRNIVIKPSKISVQSKPLEAEKKQVGGKAPKSKTECTETKKTLETKNGPKTSASYSKKDGTKKQSSKIVKSANGCPSGDSSNKRKTLKQKTKVKDKDQEITTNKPEHVIETNTITQANKTNNASTQDSSKATNTKRDSKNSAVLVDSVKSASEDCTVLGKVEEKIKGTRSIPKKNHVCEVSSVNCIGLSRRQTGDRYNENINDVHSTNKYQSVDVPEQVSQNQLMESYRHEGIEVSITSEHVEKTQKGKEPDHSIENPISHKRTNLNAVTSSERQVLKLNCPQINDDIPLALKNNELLKQQTKHFVKKIRPKNEMVQVFHGKNIESNNKTVFSANNESEETESIGKNTENGANYAKVVPIQLDLDATSSILPIVCRKEHDVFPYKAVRNLNTHALSSYSNSSPSSSKTIAKPSVSSDSDYPVVEGSHIPNKPNTEKVWSPAQSTQIPSKNANVFVSPKSTSPNKSGSFNQISGLTEEMVTKRYERAANSINNIHGNSDMTVVKDISARGKLFTAKKENDEASTEFLNERITMWKERTVQTPGPERHAKSADISRRKEKLTEYTPKSSIYTLNRLDYENKSNSPTFNAAIGAIYSRDKLCEKSADFVTESPCRQLSPTPKCLSSILDVQSYGSSSSTTPDIYDEFARKRKPKPPKTEPSPNSKSLTKPVAPNLHQTRKTVQSPLTLVFKPASPNFHNVGYSSTTKQRYQDEQVVKLCNPERKLKQIYQQSTKPSKNNLLSCSMAAAVNQTSSQKLSACVDAHSNKNASSSCPMCVDQVGTQAHYFLQRPGSTNNERKSFVPEFPRFAAAQKVKHLISASPCEAVTVVKSIPSISSGSKSSESSISISLQSGKTFSTESSSSLSSGVSNIPAARPETTYPENQNQSVSYSDNSKDGDRKISLLDKMTKFAEGIVEPRQSDSLDSVDNIRKILQTDPLQTATYVQTIGPNQTVRNIGRSAEYPNRSTNEKNVEKQRPISQTLSRINSQMYFQLPGSNILYPVFGNMLIPGNAQFFMPADDHGIKNQHMTQTVTEASNLSRIQTSTSYNGSIENRTQENLPEENVQEGKSTFNVQSEHNTEDIALDELLKAKANYLDIYKDVGKLDSHHDIFLHTTKLKELANKYLERKQQEGTERFSEEIVDRSSLQSADEKVESYCVLKPSPDVLNASKSTSPRKCFKEVVEEKRALKRREDKEAPDKTFWESAQKNCLTQARGSFSDADGGSVRKKNQVVEYLIETGESKMAESKDNTKHKIQNADKTRPKTTGSVFPRKPSNTRKTGRPKTSVCKNLVKEQNEGVKNISKKRGCSEPLRVRDSPKLSNLKNKDSMFPKQHIRQAESNDCSYKILSALRRLAIEKPEQNISHSERSCSRQRLLRSHVSRNTSTNTRIAEMYLEGTCIRKPDTEVNEAMYIQHGMVQQKFESSKDMQAIEETNDGVASKFEPGTEVVIEETLIPPSDCYVFLEKLDEQGTGVDYSDCENENTNGEQQGGENSKEKKKINDDENSQKDSEGSKQPYCNDYEQRTFITQTSSQLLKEVSNEFESVRSLHENVLEVIARLKQQILIDHRDENFNMNNQGSVRRCQEKVKVHNIFEFALGVLENLAVNGIPEHMYSNVLNLLKLLEEVLAGKPITMNLEQMLGNVLNQSIDQQIQMDNRREGSMVREGYPLGGDINELAPPTDVETETDENQIAVVSIACLSLENLEESQIMNITDEKGQTYNVHESDPLFPTLLTLYQSSVETEEDKSNFSLEPHSQEYATEEVSQKEMGKVPFECPSKSDDTGGSSKKEITLVNVLNEDEYDLDEKTLVIDESSGKEEITTERIDLKGPCHSTLKDIEKLKTKATKTKSRKPGKTLKSSTKISGKTTKVNTTKLKKSESSYKTVSSNLNSSGLIDNKKNKAEELHVKVDDKEIKQSQVPSVAMNFYREILSSENDLSKMKSNEQNYVDIVASKEMLCETNDDGKKTLSANESLQIKNSKNIEKLMETDLAEPSEPNKTEINKMIDSLLVMLPKEQTLTNTVASMLQDYKSVLSNLSSMDTKACFENIKNQNDSRKTGVDNEKTEKIHTKPKKLDKSGKMKWNDGKVCKLTCKPIDDDIIMKGKTQTIVNCQLSDIEDSEAPVSSGSSYSQSSDEDYKPTDEEGPESDTTDTEGEMETEFDIGSIYDDVAKIRGSLGLPVQKKLTKTKQNDSTSLGKLRKHLQKKYDVRNTSTVKQRHKTSSSTGVHILDVKNSKEKEQRRLVGSQHSKSHNKIVNKEIKDGLDRVKTKTHPEKAICHDGKTSLKSDKKKKMKSKSKTTMQKTIIDPDFKSVAEEAKGKKSDSPFRHNSSRSLSNIVGEEKSVDLNNNQLKEQDREQRKQWAGGFKKSASEVKSNESVYNNSGENEGNGESSDGSLRFENNRLITKRKKPKKKKCVKISKKDDNESDEDKNGKEESVAAEGFIKTQMKYYDIIRSSSKGITKPNNTNTLEEIHKRPLSLNLVEVPSGVPVRGERLITRALADAQKALEGTGGKAGDGSDDNHDDDDDDEDDGVVIEDLINSCTYKLIEDEDKLQLGGIAYFKEFVLPFVYINGYKYTPLKDVLPMFQPEYCSKQCTIPRSVLQKHKPLVKTFSTWEQVYKIELIKMKKGPPITTGDTLLKLDSVIGQLHELIDNIVELHRNTKLKRSQQCNVKAYKLLKEKLT